MKFGMDVEDQFLVATDYSDRNRFPGSQKKRCIDDVVRLMDFPAADLEQNVARLKSRVCRRGTVENLGHFCIRTAFSFQCLHQLRANPAMPHFAKAQKIAANFFGSFYRQSVTG